MGCRRTPTWHDFVRWRRDDRILSGSCDSAPSAGPVAGDGTGLCAPLSAPLLHGTRHPLAKRGAGIPRSVERGTGTCRPDCRAHRHRQLPGHRHVPGRPRPDDAPTNWRTCSCPSRPRPTKKPHSSHHVQTVAATNRPAIGRMRRSRAHPYRSVAEPARRRS